jgi:hypothetical protein
MTAEKPAQETIDHMHRWFAIECNNQVWELASAPVRSPEQDFEMLSSAYAAAHHWSKIGTSVNVARAGVTLAHAASLLGQGDLALQYARRSLAFFEQNPATDWDIAFAHAEMALAAAVNGDTPLYALHYDRARTLGEAIQDEEDRKVFFEEFSRLPKL